MHEDRDHYIILITLLPIILFVGLYATWRSAGEPSFDVPILPIPTIPLPDIPSLQVYVPPWLMSWFRNIQRNGDSIFPAIGFGVFMGLVGMGSIIDLGKKVWRRFVPERKPEENVSDDFSSPDFA